MLKRRGRRAMVLDKEEVGAGFLRVPLLMGGGGMR